MRFLAAFFSVVAIAACGARSSLDVPDTSTGAGGAAGSSSASSMQRNCPFDCTIGHQCCIGGCNGPAAVMPNDCCQCLPGEISTFNCNEAKCGGG